jgi:hypothetical protein
MTCSEPLPYAVALLERTECQHKFSELSKPSFVCLLVDSLSGMEERVSLII